MLTSAAHNRIGWATLAGVVAVFLYLMAGLPYATGYGQEKMTLFFRMYENYGNPDWTHCLFAPFVTLGLVWFFRSKWMGLPVRGHWIGLPILLIGFLAYWFGYAANIRYVGFASIQILMAGALLWFLGWRWLWALLLPLAFVTFWWPVPPLMSGSITVKLREIMTVVTGGFLNTVGIDTFREGTSLSSMPDSSRGLALGEHFQIGVDNPCSGLRSLFALLMVGTIMAFVMHRKAWKRVLLIALVVPITMLGNFGRLLALVFGTMQFGAEFAIGGGQNGPTTSGFHLWAGIAVFLVGSALLYLCALLLEGRLRFKSRGNRTVRRRSQTASA